MQIFNLIKSLYALTMTLPNVAVLYYTVKVVLYTKMF